MFIGVDLGGTNIAAAIVDEDGAIKKTVSIPTVAKDENSVIRGIINTCEGLLKDTDEVPQSIGIGVPGAVRDDIGMVVFTPNLPLKHVYMAKEISERFGCPVRLGNDANCAALGEVIAGSAKGMKNVTMITLGTGLGGGFIIDGKLHTGLSGSAGELGHMVIFSGGRDCGCGRKGCWESYASATGLKITATEFLENHQDSLIWELCSGNLENLNGRIIFNAYREADAAAVFIVNQYISHLAVGIVNIINLLEPELLCVGGGISDAWDCIEEPLKAAVDSERFARFADGSVEMKIAKAELGNDAGIIGAAMLGK